MISTYILNDLYVTFETKKGAGEVSLEEEKHFAIYCGARGLSIKTLVENPVQELHEPFGFKKDNEVFHYAW